MLANGVVQQALYAATNRIIGVALAYMDSTRVPCNFLASAAGGWVLLADSVQQRFIVQEDSRAASMTRADCGLNTQLVWGHGNTTTGLSGVRIAQASLAVTYTLPIRVIDEYEPFEGGVTHGSWKRWIVQINGHQLQAGGSNQGIGF